MTIASCTMNDINPAIRIVDRDLTAPPGGPAEGSFYIVAATGTGAWAGHDNEIVWYRGGVWTFLGKNTGWAAYIVDETIPVYWNGTAWTSYGGGTPGGINTSVQFNDSGVFGGTTDFLYTKATGLLETKGTFKCSTGVTYGAVEIYSQDVPKALIMGLGNSLTGVTTNDHVLIGRALSAPSGAGDLLMMGSNISSINSGSNWMCIGLDMAISSATVSNSVCISLGGSWSAASITNSVFVGTPSASSSNCVGIGRLYTCGPDSVVIGRSSSGGATGAIAIGNSALVDPTHTNSIAIGKSSASTSSNQCAIGSAATPLKLYIADTTNAALGAGAINTLGGIRAALNIIAEGGVINAFNASGSASSFATTQSTTSYSQCSAGNGNSTSTFVRTWGSAAVGTRFGFNLANVAHHGAQGVSLVRMLLGPQDYDVPINIGINDTEIARFTGATLATQSFNIFYTTATSSGTTGALVVAGGVGIAGDCYVGGKLTVVGLIDPTGLALTPVAANPGGALSASTVWVNTLDSNKLYFGPNPVGGGGGGVPAGITGDVQVNNAGAFGVVSGFKYLSGTLSVPGIVEIENTTGNTSVNILNTQTNYASRLLVQNNDGSDLATVLLEANPDTTIRSYFGQNAANAAVMVTYGLNNFTRMFFGVSGIDRPIHIGINASEIWRYSSGVLATGVATCFYELNASNSSTASVVLAGGLAVAKKIYAGSDIFAQATASVEVRAESFLNTGVSAVAARSDNATTAKIYVEGSGSASTLFGLTVQNAAIFAGEGAALNKVILGSTRNAPIYFGLDTLEIAKFDGNTIGGGYFQINYTTDSGNISSGAFRVLGGAGIAKNLYVGSNFECLANGKFLGGILEVSSVSSVGLIYAKGGSATETGNIYGENDTGVKTHIASFGSSRPDSFYGLSAANAAYFYAEGTNLSSFLIGTYNKDVQIRIGINSIEAMRFTGGTQGTDYARINYNSDATSPTSGAFRCAGGISSELTIFGRKIIADFSAAGNITEIKSINTLTNGEGKVFVENDTGVLGNLHSYGSLNATSNLFGQSIQNAIVFIANGASLSRFMIGTNAQDVPLHFGINNTELVRLSGATLSTQYMQVFLTTEASSATTGALRVDGGVGIAKKLYVGGPAKFSKSVTFQVASYSGDKTLDTDHTVAIYTGSGGNTFTLPAANATGSGLLIVVKNRGSGTLSVSRAGSDTIDGSASALTLNPADGVILYSDGTSDWILV